MDALHDYCSHPVMMDGKHVFKVLNGAISQEFARVWMGISQVIIDNTVVLTRSVLVIVLSCAHSALLAEKHEKGEHA